MYLGTNKPELELINNIINLKSEEIKENKTANKGAGIYFIKMCL